MDTIYIENTKKIRSKKPLLEKKLNIKLNIRDKKVTITGRELDEYLASQILQAIDKGFEVEQALLLQDEDYVFEIINIKDLTHRTDISQIRARIIGRKGKTLKVIQTLTNCEIVLHDNQVYIIGPAEKIKDAMNGLKKLIQGSKQSSTYSYLERARKHLKSDDLGLKTEK